METVRRLFQLSGKTLDELGAGMGYPPESARKSAWQFIRQTNDPRISMLRKFCGALGIPLAELVAEKKHNKSST